MDRENSRKEIRKGLNMAVAFRTSMDRTTVAVLNISERGCQLANAYGHLQVGSRVMLRPEGFESFVGIVRWCAHGKAGVEFESSLHPAIVDHLCRKYPQNVATIGIQLAA